MVNASGAATFSIPTEYRGILMRSRLEANIGFLLENLYIKWEYEPRWFLLENGQTYLPDFFLPELNTWIEGKGIITEMSKEAMREFVKNRNTEIILISDVETLFFSSKKEDIPLDGDDDIFIGKCSHCHKYFFTSNMGSYFCRHCNAHEGDHDLKHYFEHSTSHFSDMTWIKELIMKLRGIRR